MMNETERSFLNALNDIYANNINMHYFFIRSYEQFADMYNADNYDSKTNANIIFD